MKLLFRSAGSVVRLALACAVFSGGAADAPAITLWPTDWLTNMGTDPGAYSGTWRPLLGTNGQFYTDTLGDVTPGEDDIVGGTYQDHHGNGPFPAGFYYVDTTNVMFRMRLNGDPLQIAGGNTNFVQKVWAVFFNNDASNDVDWIVQIDAKTDDQMELVTNNITGGAGTGWDVDNDTPHVTIQDLAFTNAEPLFRVFNATDIDGSHYHAVAGNDDYFIDMAIPWTIFTNNTDIGYLEPFEIVLITSAQHNQYAGPNVNKDTPESYWSATVAIPEPSIGLMIVPLIGLALVCARRRRRNPAP